MDFDFGQWIGDVRPRQWMLEQGRAWLSMNQYQHLLELLCVVLLFYLYLQRAYKPKRGRKAQPPTKEEVDAACEKWISQPLSAPASAEACMTWERNSLASANDLLITSDAGPRVDIVGHPDVINLGSFNFQGLHGDKRVKEACIRTMEKYGCGSCGPRGFYGTMDMHLNCESRVAKFCGSDDAIIYSFGTATNSSVIPAFCKRGDIIICDEGVNYAVQAGCKLCRSDIYRFKHNDISDLKRILEEVRKGDMQDPKRPMMQRRFIIVEGLYTDYGDFAPVEEIIRLKNEYRFRLVLDESNTFGVLGENGGGLCEKLNIPRSEVEITTADFANSFGTIGGFCVGERIVVNHQRLSGAGYCFSASQPPYLAAAAIEAMDIIDSEGRQNVNKLALLTSLFRKGLVQGLGQDYRVLGDDASPIVHIGLANEENNRRAQEIVLRKQKELLLGGVFLAAPLYVGSVHTWPSPTLRATLSAAHSEDDIKLAVETICRTL
mmetsp:Transcript_8826/g.26527  ORF Transcript_8826/g.26527 Transcript_8826/m.26527 type:complete len:491 (+) Transcript_8826:183-1655(+)